MKLLALLLLSLTAAQSAELIVAAAADLAPLQAPLTAAFHHQTGQTVRFTIGSSGELARQIRSGAPYDVYLSANEQYVKDLSAAGFLDPTSVKTYAHGRIALYSKSGAYKTLNDLLAARVLHVAIANPQFAPYGVAARQALEHEKLWKRIEPKIVYGENIRETLQYAESGNVEAALVSWSLVYNRGGIELSASWHAPINQAGGVVARSAQPALAGRFLQLLVGPAGAKILASHGLEP
ncbi:MAG: molybdate ABC transporter substrate-binding protein [Bryobacteraceae bacterium]